MWSGGDDWNARGERVRLYQPNLHGRNRAVDDASVSFIGGSPPDREGAPRCGICRDPLFLLVHLVAPQRNGAGSERCVEVFACNTPSCTSSLLRGNPLCYGGGGVVACRRRNLPSATDNEVQAAAPPTTVGSVDATMDEDNDWSVTPGGEDQDVEALERKLAAMEASTQTEVKPVPPKERSDAKPLQQDERHHSFPSFPLTSQLEPAAPRLPGAADDDDVGMSTGSDDKIQAMLARYMAEEVDEAILSALRGSGATGGGAAAAAGGRERDERLPASERALLAYMDRLKRSPRQVLRYAYGGVPMWSIPEAKPEQQSKPKPKSRATATDKQAAVQEIPACSCCASRVFEFQLLPSLLHVLEVDQHAAAGSSGGGENGRSLTSLEAAYAQSGMNFGNIAVYTCSKGCEASDAEYVVVQDSVDDAPLQRRTAATDDNEPVVIAEGTQFDDEDDDDAEMYGSDSESGHDGEEAEGLDFTEMNENDKRV